MKRIFFITASVLLATAANAQTGVRPDNSLYQFNNTVKAKEVRQLGTNPEFPFLRNLSTGRDVYTAMRRHGSDNTADGRKLNSLLMQIGYTNGVRDVNPEDISLAYITPGTEGNMGSRGHTYSYYKLAGAPSEYRAWRIAPNGSGYSALYLFAKCGNAFYPKTGDRTACIKVPVQLNADAGQIRLNSSGRKVTNTEEAYVYYSRRKGKKGERAYSVAGINAQYPSSPVMLNAKKKTEVQPETYTISITSPQQPVFACADSTLNLTASLNVEKTSSYTGYYPDRSNKTYKEVSKRDYKVIARKMRKVQKKEMKVARKTGTPVEVRVARL
jgi:hypothetical protein